VAQSLDGKTALENGASQWITGPEARADGHRWRARACAILTGSGTVLADDPQLTVRVAGVSRQPLRVVVDSRLETPVTAQVLPALIVTASQDAGRRAALTAAGAEILDLPDGAGRVDLAALLAELAQRGINEVHSEGGAGLNGALLAAGLVDELLLYLAPCLLGDRAQGAFALPSLTDLATRPQLKIHDSRALGGDWRIVARLATL
jgi:diaminohydroxyphosphoribosylaminopyrimidine deaminase/5-amino-6-(5-phosphoribosylamino)uracil reductase